MFCPKCGAQLPDGTTFCTSCGQSLAQQAAPQQQPYQQQPYQQPYQQQPYQQPYQQQPVYKAPVQELPTQPFTSQGIIATFMHNISKPALWGIPQFIAMGAAFFYIFAMIMPYVSYGGYSVNYYSAGASRVIPAFLLIFFVAACSITKNGCIMIIAGGVFFFHTLFNAVGGSNLSVGFVFMLLASLATLGAGIFQFILEQQKK